MKEVALPASPNSDPIATVALVGNPNTGKTTLFNRLTGMRQRVGNYPGITVAKSTGKLSGLNGREVELIDLPGCYSLAATSPDERVVIDVLKGHMEGTSPPDLVVCVADATNLQRNLFLLSQLSDLDLPVILVLNLWDQVKRRRLHINLDLLRENLGIPVIPTIAVKNIAVDKLKKHIFEGIVSRPKMKPLQWPAFMDQAVDGLKKELAGQTEYDFSNGEWRRLIFDANSAILERVENHSDHLQKTLDRARDLIRHAGYNPYAAEAILHYQYLDERLAGVVSDVAYLSDKTTERLDRVLTHRIWGFVVFAVLVYFVFQSVYSWSGPAMDGVASLKSILQGAVSGWGSGYPTLKSLISDGLIEGVGAVVIFLPQIAILFFFIAILEDSGYLSRAAFTTNRLMSWCGLNGKSFIPLLSSYACAVPGIMAARTIEDPKARLITILIAPLMSCSARLPVYVLMIGAFIEPRYGPSIAGLVLFGMHFVGLAVALPIAWILNRFILKSRSRPFLLEMPPYRMPRPWDVCWRVWGGVVDFLAKAGTLIFAITIIMWVFLYFPRPPSVEEEVNRQFMAALAVEENISLEAALHRVEESEELQHILEAKVAGTYLEQSFLGRIGKKIQPVFDPAGFDWKITVGVLASFPAREVIVATLGTIYSLGGDIDEESSDLRTSLKNERWKTGPKSGQPVFTIPVVLSILVFFALCQQCGSTLAVIARELNMGWAIFSFLYMTALAWVASVLVYQIGFRLMG